MLLLLLFPGFLSVSGENDLQRKRYQYVWHLREEEPL